MAIPAEVIEQIRNFSAIESVIGEYVPDLKQAGRNWKCCCPFHTEKTPSFVVSPEKGIFRCFGCGVAGDVFKFVMLIEKISWMEAVKKLAQKVGIKIEDTQENKIVLSQKAKIFQLLETAAKFYHRCFLETKAAENARIYAKQRGLTDKTIEKFMIGYSPKNKLVAAALKKGYTYDMLLKAGLITKMQNGQFFEYMSERLVFPIMDLQGRVVAFGGRTLTNQKTKYINSPETIVYSKSANLYGLFNTLPELRQDRRIFLLEGYMDVVMTQQYGVSGTVASLGTSFTPQQSKLIGRYADKVILLFDPDQAGKTATKRALDIFAGTDIPVKVATLPEELDPDEFLLKYGKEKFDKFIETKTQNAIEFIVEDVFFNIDKNSPQAKARAISTVLDFVVKTKNIIVQREYIKYIAQKLSIEEELLLTELNKKVLKSNNIQNKNNIINKNTKQQDSLEEDMLKFLLEKGNRGFIKKLDNDFFMLKNCSEIYEMLKADNNISVAEIQSKLDGEKAQWFSKIAFDNSFEKSDKDETFDTLYKDIFLAKLEKRRKEIEPNVLLMLDGKIKDDPEQIKEYKKLTAKIKGSRKNK